MLEKKINSDFSFLATVGADFYERMNFKGRFGTPARLGAASTNDVTAKAIPRIYSLYLGVKYRFP